MTINIPNKVMHLLLSSYSHLNFWKCGMQQQLKADCVVGNNYNIGLIVHELGAVIMSIPSSAKRLKSS